MTDMNDDSDAIYYRSSSTLRKQPRKPEGIWGKFWKFICSIARWTKFVTVDFVKDMWKPLTPLGRLTLFPLGFGMYLVVMIPMFPLLFSIAVGVELTYNLDVKWWSRFREWIWKLFFREGS